MARIIPMLIIQRSLLMKKEEKDKHVKISADRHRQLKLLSAKTGKEMRDIMNEAFDLYVANLNKVGK